MSESDGTRQVRYSRDASRTLKRIDRRTARRIRVKIVLLAADPDALANNISALKGEPGVMRLRIGDWRVIFAEGPDILRVLKIAPRGSAYDGG
jgi:mRNA interferase RelE/StbE